MNSSVALGGAILGGVSSPIVNDMYIFHDEVYIILCVIGLTLSILGYLHEMLNDKKDRGLKRKLAGFIKAFITGAIVTPLSFLLLTQLGDKYLKASSYMDSGLNDLYFFLSLILGYFSTPIWDYIVKRVLNAISK